MGRWDFKFSDGFVTPYLVVYLTAGGGGLTSVSFTRSGLG